MSKVDGSDGTAEVPVQLRGGERRETPARNGEKMHTTREESENSVKNARLDTMNGTLEKNETNGAKKKVLTLQERPQIVENSSGSASQVVAKGTARPTMKRESKGAPTKRGITSVPAAVLLTSLPDVCECAKCSSTSIMLEHRKRKLQSYISQRDGTPQVAAKALSKKQSQSPRFRKNGVSDEDQVPDVSMKRQRAVENDQIALAIRLSLQESDQSSNPVSAPVVPPSCAKGVRSLLRSEDDGSVSIRVECSSENGVVLKTGIAKIFPGAARGGRTAVQIVCDCCGKCGRPKWLENHAGSTKSKPTKNLTMLNDPKYDLASIIDAITREHQHMDAS